MASLPADQIAGLRSLTMENAIRFWDGFEAAARKVSQAQLQAAVRALCQIDLFYLLVRACKRTDMLHPWIYARVREVEANPYGYLDLWSREHYKSSIITFGLTIRDILNNPNVTTGIFSHTRPIAKAFLRQIMRELESNQILHAAFPDILWGKDVRQAPKWSEDDGIIVKRSSNPNEATVEAWGLVDGQPVSKHFWRLHYDDIVVQASVTTPEMLEKTLVALEQSYNLGTMDGVRSFAGTRYHFNDCYRTITDRGTVKVRTYPGTNDGTEFGNPVLVTPKRLAELRRDMGPHTFAAQILLNPKADALLGFKREWLMQYKAIGQTKWLKMSRYLLVDPASSKKKGSDYTSMGVIGLGTDGNYYLLDGVRDRLNLTERTARLMQLHRDWQIQLPVRYEKYGMQADIEHIKSQQEIQNYRFPIIEVGGQTKKEDRIGRLIPIFEQRKFYLPQHLFVTDYQKVVRDLVRDFIEEEFVAFPVGIHDDFLDMISRIAEPELRLVWPREEVYVPPPQRQEYPNQNVAWMG